MARVGYRFPKVPAEDRFWQRVVPATTGCWTWTGARSTRGYGQFNPTADGHVPAHRWAYELLIGAIPDGLVIDHLCRTRLCVNPTHMEPVTNRENLVRGVGLIAVQVTKTHCPKGHEYAGDNLILHGGSRQCRTCKNDRQRATRQPRDEATNARRRAAYRASRLEALADKLEAGT